MGPSPKRERAYDRTLAAWAKQWRDTYLSPPTLRLIALATHDLYEGPQEGFSFAGACEHIKRALDNMPRELYIDDDAEVWTETEPCGERCEGCDGEGCAECDGRGVFEPGGSWWHVDCKALRTAIVGKELEGYIR